MRVDLVAWKVEALKCKCGDIIIESREVKPYFSVLGKEDNT